MYTTDIYIIFERGISFLIILKLCEFFGFQTKLVFKQSFKYLKNEKFNLSKLILKLLCLLYLNPYPTMTGLKKTGLYVKDEDWTFFAQCILLNNLHPSGL